MLALKPDSVSSSHAGIIGAALTAYSSLSDEAKALLSAEKALLDSLVDALSEAQPPFDGDDFSDALKGKWVTYGDVTAQHTIADGVFHPATAAAAHKPTPAPPPWPTGRCIRSLPLEAGHRVLRQHAHQLFDVCRHRRRHAGRGHGLLLYQSLG